MPLRVAIPREAIDAEGGEQVLLRERVGVHAVAPPDELRREDDGPAVVLKLRAGLPDHRAVEDERRPAA
jgi:hypothetical protein